MFPATHDHAFIEDMHQETQPATEPAFWYAGDAGAPESSENVQATLQRVNEAARAAAEGSTGQAADSSPADADDGQAEVQKMLDAMSRAMEGDGEDANSLVETLMHGLLSKEVLLDPLKVRKDSPILRFTCHMCHGQ